MDNVIYLTLLKKVKLGSKTGLENVRIANSSLSISFKNLAKIGFILSARSENYMLIAVAFLKAFENLTFVNVSLLFSYSKIVK